MSASLPLRALVLATGDAEDGQSRMAVMLAHALAAAGGEAHLITAGAPPGLPGLAGLAPGRVWAHRLDRVPEGLLGGAADWVLVAPPVIPRPGFEADCLDVLGRAAARLALLHPPADGPPGAAWDAVQRLGRLGGLVISPGASAERQARALHAGWAGRLRFEVWHPAIDSLRARTALGEARDGSLLLPVEAATAAAALERVAGIDLGLLRGRVLRVVGGLPEGALSGLRARGVQAELAEPESEEARFALLARAAALLLPVPLDAASWPVEAAYLGTPVAAVPQPLWRDWLGDLGCWAGTPAEFGTALAAALERDGMAMREALRPVLSLEGAGARLADLLLRAQPVTAPCRPRTAGLVELAPVGKDAPAVAAEVLGAWEDGAGGVVVTLRGGFPAGAEELEAQDMEGRTLAAVWRGEEGLCHLFLPAGGSAALIPLREGRPMGPGITLRLRRVSQPPSWQHPLCTIEDERVEGGTRLVQGWVAAGRRLHGVLLSPDGKAWFHQRQLRPRPEVLGRHPAGATLRCGLDLRLPTEPPPDPGRARLLCLDRDGVAYAQLTGWPPRGPGPAR